MPFRPAPTRGSAPIDKSKKPAFRDASQVTHVRDINTVGSYVSTNGVLTSVKKAMQAATGGNFVLSSTDFRAESDSRIRQTRIQQPLPTVYQDVFNIEYNSSGNVNMTLFANGSSTDNGYCVRYDSSGNIIVGGNFITDITASDRLGRSFFSLTNPSFPSNAAAFLIKYDSNGTPSWISMLTGGEAGDVYVDVTSDSAGNIYALAHAGSIGIITNANGTSYTNNVNYTSYSTGSYVVKYNPSGFVQWVIKADGNGNSDIPAGICIDPSGNVTFCGRTFTDMGLYNADGTLFSPTVGIPPAGISLFLAQYTSAGTANWHAEMITSQGGWPMAEAVTSDSNGNLNVCGYYPNGTLTFMNKNNGTAFATVLSAAGGDSNPYSFVGQYSSTGNVNWAAKIRAGSSGVYVTDCDTDSLGNVIVCGGFGSGHLFVDNANATTFPSSGVTIASASSSGTATTYTTSSAHGLTIGLTVEITGTSNALHNVSPVRIATVPTPTTFTINNTVANGQTSTGGTVSFQPSVYYSSSFVVKYSSTGVVQWVAIQVSEDRNTRLSEDGTTILRTYDPSGSWGGNANARAVSIDRSTNNINVSGNFGSSVLVCYNGNGTFHPINLLNTSQHSNIFMVQYSPEGNVNWVTRVTRRGNNTNVYGSDTSVGGNITITGTTEGSLVSYDKSGLPASTNIYPAM
jgi:hypothetical protein